MRPSHFMAAVVAVWAAVGVLDPTLAKEDAYYAPPSLNELKIGGACIVMPLNRILLIRKDGVVCAMKFVKFWSSESGDTKYSAYEVYSKINPSLPLSANNITILNEEAIKPPLPLGFTCTGHTLWLGPKELVHLPIGNLVWNSYGVLCFYERGRIGVDCGAEFAPTPWTDISQINESEPRIFWLKYDDYRLDVKIPIDKFWDEGKNKIPYMKLAYVMPEEEKQKLLCNVSKIKVGDSYDTVMKIVGPPSYDQIKYLNKDERLYRVLLYYTKRRDELLYEEFGMRPYAEYIKIDLDDNDKVKYIDYVDIKQRCGNFNQ